MTGRRQQAERRGRQAEIKTALFLLCKGYWPLARRFRTPVGEIDLIMRRGGTIVFVEVKARNTLESGLDAVDVNGQARIRRAAGWWLAKHPRYADRHCRFDVVVVPKHGWPVHITGAFEL